MSAERFSESIILLDNHLLTTSPFLNFPWTIINACVAVRFFGCSVQKAAILSPFEPTGTLVKIDPFGAMIGGLTLK